MQETPYTIPNSDLSWAVRRGNLDLAKRAIAEGANPNYDNALHQAVDRKNIEIVNLLLDNGADPNLKTTAGLTPLMLAKSAEMLKLLIARGANPKIDDGDGNNAAAYYISYNCLDTLEAWMELDYPMVRITKKLLYRLLSKCRFDMITLLTGFQFKAEHPLARAAEFKVRWGV